jgi:hypothetical protein
MRTKHEVYAGLAAILILCATVAAIVAMIVYS